MNTTTNRFDSLRSDINISKSKKEPSMNIRREKMPQVDEQDGFIRKLSRREQRRDRASRHTRNDTMHTPQNNNHQPLVENNRFNNLKSETRVNRDRNYHNRNYQNRNYREPKRIVKFKVEPWVMNQQPDKATNLDINNINLFPELSNKSFETKEEKNEESWADKLAKEKERQKELEKLKVYPGQILIRKEANGWVKYVGPKSNEEIKLEKYKEQMRFKNLSDHLEKYFDDMIDYYGYEEYKHLFGYPDELPYEDYYDSNESDDEEYEDDDDEYMSADD